MKKNDERPSFRLPGLPTGILVVAALYFGRELLIPLAFAAFLTFLLLPIVRGLERLRLGRATATISVVCVGLLVVAAAGLIVLSQGAELVANYPQYRHNVLSKIRNLRVAWPSTLQVVTQAAEEIGQEISRPLTTAPASQPAEEESAPAEHGRYLDEPPSVTEREAPDGSAGDDAPLRVQVVPQGALIENFLRLFGPVVHPLATIGIAIVFVIFFLIYNEDLLERAIRVSARAGVSIPPKALVDAGARVMRYVVALAIVNLVNGTAIALGLWAIGMPSVLLWGLMAAVLRFIPVLGPWIAGAFPFVLSIAIYDGWIQPALVLALYLSVDLVMINLLEPWFYGGRTGASPTAILFAYVFWTWLWGGIGLFLAAPITVCLVALGRQVPALEAFSIMLGDERLPKPSRARRTSSRGQPS